MRGISEVDASMCAAVAAMLASKKESRRNGNIVERIAGMALSYTACKDHKLSSCPQEGDTLQVPAATIDQADCSLTTQQSQCSGQMLQAELHAELAGVIK